MSRSGIQGREEHFTAVKSGEGKLKEHRMYWWRSAIMAKNIVITTVQNVRKTSLRVTRLVDIWNGLAEYLGETEEVDHKDYNPENNSSSNLR